MFLLGPPGRSPLLRGANAPRGFFDVPPAPAAAPSGAGHFAEAVRLKKLAPEAPAGPINGGPPLGSGRGGPRGGGPGAGRGCRRLLPRNGFRPVRGRGGWERFFRLTWSAKTVPCASWLL